MRKTEHFMSLVEHIVLFSYIHAPPMRTCIFALTHMWAHKHTFYNMGASVHAQTHRRARTPPPKHIHTHMQAAKAGVRILAVAVSLEPSASELQYKFAGLLPIKFM